METNEPILLELCWLLNNQLNAEKEYRQALWNTAYYRKVKKQLNKKENKTEISKKISTCQVIALRKQEKLLKLNQRQQCKIGIKLKALNAKIIRLDSRFEHLAVTDVIKNEKVILPIYMVKTYNKEQIAEMADQYEANKTLDKVLTNEE